MKSIPNHKCPLGDHLQHYWDRLSDREKTMQFDEEGLFSLAPQKVALYIADSTPGNLIVDAFCGVGGSSIGYALRGKRVIAIDTDSSRLKMAKYNAEIFGVCSKIEFLEGNCVQILPTLKPDTIFLDPPWGGTDYGKYDKFKLSNFDPDGRSMLELSFQITGQIVMRLPKNFDLDELTQFNRIFNIQKNLLDGIFMHYCAYFK